MSMQSFRVKELPGHNGGQPGGYQERKLYGANPIYKFALSQISIAFDIITVAISHQPHDKYFKASLKERQIAVDFLKSHLQPGLYQRLDLSTLHLTDKSLGMSELREIHCDIVYKCTIDGKDGYIPIIFQLEHLASAPKHMALYVLQGSVSLMAQHLKEGHEKLPLVLPICIYHGKTSPYPNSTDIFDHFEDPDLARALVFKPFSLVDLTTMTEDTIRQHGAAALMELLFKWYSAKNLLEALKQATDGAVWRLTLSHTTELYFEAVLEYLCSTGNQNQSADELKEILSKLLPEKRESIMNFAQQLEQRGKQIGYHEGYQRALQATYADAWRAAQQDAEHKTKIKTARRMLNAGFPMESVKLVTDLGDEDLVALSGTTEE